MNKIKSNQTEFDKEVEMLPEYDFSNGVCGKHASAYQNGYIGYLTHEKDDSTEIQEFKFSTIKK